METTLRDHPSLTDSGVCNWPPTWFWTSGHRGAVAAGEVGTLQRSRLMTRSHRNVFCLLNTTERLLWAVLLVTRRLSVSK